MRYVMPGLLLLITLPLTAAKTGAIVGTVTFEGMPLPGVMVTASSDAGTRVTTTDGEGRYRLEGLSLGTRYVVAANFPGLRQARKRRVVADAESTVDIVLRLLSVKTSTWMMMEPITSTGEFTITREMLDNLPR